MKLNVNVNVNEKTVALLRNGSSLMDYDKYYMAPDGSIWESEDAYNAYTETFKLATQSLEHYYIDPDGNFWASEGDYNAYIGAENLATQSSDDYYIDPDGNVWESSTEYYDYMNYVASANHLQNTIPTDYPTSSSLSSTDEYARKVQTELERKEAEKREKERQLQEEREIAKEAEKNAFAQIAEAIENFKNYKYANRKYLLISPQYFWQYRYSDELSSEDKPIYDRILAWVYSIKKEPFSIAYNILREKTNYMSILYENNISYFNLSKSIRDSVIPCGVTDEERQKLDEFIEKYRLFCSRKKILEYGHISEKRDLAEKIVRGYLGQENDDLDSYLVNNNISKKEFTYFLIRLQQDKNPLYREYRLLEDQKSKSNREYLVSVAKKMATSIKNGIQVSENVNRPFDLLDYFEATTLPFQKFYSIVNKNLTALERGVITEFMNKMEAALENDVRPNSIYDMKIIIGGKEISIDEKKMVIDYLSRKNIPLLDKTFSLALRRYLAGDLILETEDSIGQAGKHM